MIDPHLKKTSNNSTLKRMVYFSKSPGITDWDWNVALLHRICRNPYFFCLIVLFS
jgi:hypothetical protein